MKRVTVIGSSHVACTKLAWTKLQDSYAGRSELRFFAVGWPAFGHLRLDAQGRYGLPGDADADTQHRVRSVNQETQIDLTQADTVLWVGQLSPMKYLTRLITKLDIFQGGSHPSGSLVSRAAFDAFVKDRAERAAPTGPWERLTDAGVKLVIALNPQFSEDVAHSDDDGHQQIARAAAKGTRMRDAFARFETHYAAALARRGFGFVPQPACTLADNGLTKSDYSIGSVRLHDSKQHSDRDVQHMNQDYGELLLRALFTGHLGLDDDEKTTRPPQKADGAPAR